MGILLEVQKLFWRYQKLVESRVTNTVSFSQTDLDKWKDRLFTQFLIYCFPIGILALIPGVYMSFAEHYYVIGFIDLSCFFLIIIFTFVKNFTIKQRKIAIITIFYVLAIFLIANLGFIGPGIFYLLAITLLVALFFPIRYAAFSICSNAVLISIFGAVIRFKLFHSVLSSQYNLGEWIAFSSNLIFLSIILVILIRQIFNGLQSIIEKKELHKAKYQNIFENSPLPMWVLDHESLKFLDVNRSAIDKYGYSKGEFLKMTINDIAPHKERLAVVNDIAQNGAIEKFASDRFIHQTKKGEEIIVKIESSQISYNDHLAELILATDITGNVKSEQKVAKSAQKVRQSESHLRAIFESAIQGFLLLDLDDKILLFNNKAKDSIIFNIEKTDFVTGESIFNFMEQSRISSFADRLKKIKKGEVIRYDKKHVNSFGCQWIHYSLTPVYESGQLAGVCITGNDITDHKKYVQTIESQNKKFAEISWIQSHLVRAPLARIIGLAGLISEQSTDTDRKEILTYLKKSARELDDVITEITNKTSGGNFDVVKLIKASPKHL